MAVAFWSSKTQCQICRMRGEVGQLSGSFPGVEPNAPKQQIQALRQLTRRPNPRNHFEPTIINKNTLKQFWNVKFAVWSFFGFLSPGRQHPTAGPQAFACSSEIVRWWRGRGLGSPLPSPSHSTPVGWSARWPPSPVPSMWRSSRCATAARCGHP